MNSPSGLPTPAYLAGGAIGLELGHHRRLLSTGVPMVLDHALRGAHPTIPPGLATV